MIRKSRLPIVIGLTLALGITGIAYGGHGSTAFVDGKVKPVKLKKKQFRNVNLFTGVRTEANVDGSQHNPAAELVSWGKNVKIVPRAAPRCSAPLPNGGTPEQARAACPPKSYLGKGAAEVLAPNPGAPPTVIDDIVVSVFNGPAVGEVRLHTYSPTLRAAAPAVDGRIVKAPGKRYGQALLVPRSPETGALMISKFNAWLNRSTGVAKARCAAKRFLWRRNVTYKDGSKATVVRSQRCKRRS